MSWPFFFHTSTIHPDSWDFFLFYKPLRREQPHIFTPRSAKMSLATAVDAAELVFFLHSRGLKPSRIAQILGASTQSVKAIVKILKRTADHMNLLNQCKSSPNPIEAEAKLYGVKEEELFELKRMAIDPTTPICDICGPSKETSYGGVVLKEHDDSFTIICQACWETFTTKSPQTRVADTWWKQFAEKSGVGLDAKRVYEWLDITGRFDDNVRDFMVRQGDNPRSFCRRSQRRHTELCVGCLSVFLQSDIVRCDTCHKTPYCGRECMENDRTRHAPGCKAYLKSLESQKDFILPSEKCDNCGTFAVGDIKLSSCRGCPNVFYCSKTCQVTMWPKHRLECMAHKLKNACHGSGVK